MLSQEKTTDSEADWKKQYSQTLKELDIKEREWNQQQQNILKTVLRFTFAFQGSNDILDKKLLDLKAALKQSSNNIPQNEIDELVQAILKHKKEKDNDSSRTNLLIKNVVQLLSSNDQFDRYSDKVREIDNDLKNNSANPATQLKPINEIVTNINKSSAKDKQKPDAFKVFLKKLSDNQNTEPSLAALCKKSISLHNEQDKLKAISSCIDKINGQTDSTDNIQARPGTDNQNTESSIENLLSLLDWITIPGKSQAKLDTLKQQLAQREDGADTGKLLRRIALTISNAYMEIQSELKETEGFLKKVTNQLNEITLQVADIETLENESFSSSVTLNSEMEKQIELIQTGVDEAETIEDIKKTINTRMEVLQSNMDQFINVEQSRKKTSEGYHQALVERISSMEEETEKLRETIVIERNKAYNDALTGIPNRMAFDERITHEFQRWQRYNSKLTLCLVDIDKFKGVNDTYGHKAGDIVLKTIAEKCASKVRKSDFFCRYGGEEFALILPETDLSAAITVAETIRESIERCSFQYGDKDVSVTVSCGLAEVKGKDTLDKVFQRADKALYKAKETGRNRCISEDQLHLM
ncbi:MAG TPA: GGDEF domain-containing protein [Thiotrichaceae bacterium]|jgi:diguanylate cyclase|nr:GGDEF domain-containing protein [Thiotrichaceae bacterium]HIM09081.1 GGDEF domain-containing protein [Gammaproteobacteria bacterium]